MPYVLLSALAAGAFAKYVSSDARAVENVLARLVAEGRVSRAETRPARHARLAKIFDETTSQRLSVQSVDLPPAPAGRDALFTWSDMLEDADDASLELVDPRLVIEGRRANAHSDVLFKAHAGGDEWTDRRAVIFQLEKDSDAWRVSGIDIGARPNDLPEARP